VQIPDRLRSTELFRDLTSPPAERPDETVAAQRRRRIVVVTALVVGTVLLGLAFSRPAGTTGFYVLAATLAAVWLAGGVLSGPLRLGPHVNGRQLIGAALVGVLAFGIFAVGAEAVSWIPTLHHAVDDVISRADRGSRALVVAITVVNGVAEEAFFRGALFGAFADRRPEMWSIICYVVVIAASGNAMLVFAAALMGTVFALERRATGGILAPAVTHVVWSTLMIFLLPR
jgi:membrane protease YdiL (CAAX protease family)